MKLRRIASFILAAAMAATMAVGCGKKADEPKVEAGKLEGIADKVITVDVQESADENQTVFKLNNVVDSGNTDDNGGRYLYLDVTIENSTGKEYELSALNNFYILLPDKEEIHFDVRTQLYAVKHMDTYNANPFTIPANGTFNGLIGGFIVDKKYSEFTVCFFPTQDDAKNKSSVVKVNISNADIKPLT